MNSYYVIIESCYPDLSNNPIESKLVKYQSISGVFEIQKMQDVILEIPASEFTPWEPLKNNYVYIFCGKSDDIEFELDDVKDKARLIFYGVITSPNFSTATKIFSINVSRIDAPAVTSDVRVISDDINSVKNQDVKTLEAKIYQTINNYSYSKILIENNYASADVISREDVGLYFRKNETVAKQITRLNRRNQLYTMVDFDYNKQDGVVFRTFQNKTLDNRKDGDNNIYFALEGGENAIITDYIVKNDLPISYTFNYMRILEKAPKGTPAINIRSETVYNMAGTNGYVIDKSIHDELANYLSKENYEAMQKAFLKASSPNQVTKYITEIKDILTKILIANWMKDVLDYVHLRVSLPNQTVIIDNKYYTDQGQSKYILKKEIWTPGITVNIRDTDFFGDEEYRECVVRSVIFDESSTGKGVTLILQPQLKLDEVDFEKEVLLKDITNELKKSNPKYTLKDVIEKLQKNIENYPLQLKLANPKNFIGKKYWSGREF